MTSVPQLFADWINQNRQVGKKCGHTYLYHSRSNTHSIALGRLIVNDLVANSRILREHAASGKIGYGLDLRHQWPNGKQKTLDLAIGTIDREATLYIPGGNIAEVSAVSRVLIACEAKCCMTEHGKSQPRIYDELSSSHEIVHQGDQQAIACGIATVNIATQFASPLRQVKGQPLHHSMHDQPRVTERMIQHLRKLPIRDSVGQVGFDAFCTFIVDCDNVTAATLHTAVPAPQKGERDNYDTFLARIVQQYEERFAAI